MDRIIIDASGHVAGRLASFAAKQALKGNRVAIVNAEKAVISGNEGYNIRIFREKVQRGDPYKGPHYPRRADQVLKRMVRGMLPYKKPAGREAYRRVRVYLSLPEEYEKERMHRVKEAENRLRCKHISMERLSERMGAKRHG
jgi:large subunit ribosomal protein L13